MSTSVPAHEIVVSKTPEEVEACFNIRVDVFVHEQRFSLEDERD
jgi:predicted GNAT family N-acyltransferase